MDDIINKYLDDCVIISYIGIIQIEITNVDMFDDFVEVFNINSGHLDDTYQWFTNKYGPICVFKANGYTTLYNHGNWRHNIPPMVKVISSDEIMSSYEDGYMVEEVLSNNRLLISK